MKCLVVGYGKMSSPIINSWIENKLFDNICIVDPNISYDVLNYNNCFLVNKQNDISDNFIPDVIFFAIKPQIFEVIKNYQKYQNALILSIIATKEISLYEEIFSKNAKIVRLMPNLNARIKKSITLYAANNMAKKDILLIEKLLISFGDFIQLDEKYFDIATIISGSGPAFLYNFLNEFINIGIKNGLPENISIELTKKMSLSSCLMLNNGNQNLLELQEDIASKGGLTEVGLQIMNQKMKKIIEEIFLAILARSEELKKNNYL